MGFRVLGVSGFGSGLREGVRFKGLGVGFGVLGVG